MPRARWFGVRFPSRRPHRRWDPPSLLFDRYRNATSLRAKRPERDFDRSPPSSDKVRNEWSYNSTPSMTSWRTQGHLYLRFQATGRQHRGYIIPQGVTRSLVLLRMGGINARNMLSWMELLINRYCCIWLVFMWFISMMLGQTNTKFTITYVNSGVQYDTGPWPAAGYIWISQNDESTVSYKRASLFTGRCLFTVVCSHVTDGLHCGLTFMHRASSI
jgi:hypothetical protein